MPDPVEAPVAQLRRPPSARSGGRADGGQATADPRATAVAVANWQIYERRQRRILRQQRECRRRRCPPSARSGGRAGGGKERFRGRIQRWRWHRLLPRRIWQMAKVSSGGVGLLSFRVGLILQCLLICDWCWLIRVFVVKWCCGLIFRGNAEWMPSMHRLDLSWCIQPFFLARVYLKGAGFENYKPASITHIDAGFETDTNDRSHQCRLHGAGWD